jgi:Flp pilus assembly protein TadG
MGRRAVRRTRRDRGAVAVEFALLFPILLMLVFGMIDFGRALNAQITITQASRTGARLAAVGSANVITATENAAIGLNVTSPAPTFLQCPVGTTSGGGCVTEANNMCQPGAQAANQQAVITVTYKYNFVTPLKAVMGLFGSSLGSGPLTLTATGVMPCET